MSLDRYNFQQTWRWNLQNSPDPTQASSPSVPPMPGSWTWLGHSVNSCLGIPAGPLLNADWLLHYARLGFDILTYKTVRTAARECYELPNLVPVECEALSQPGTTVPSCDRMHRDWAVSFGMPSVEPTEWRADVCKAKQGLAAGQLLTVSVVGDAKDASDSEQLNALADDYALCAAWAVESGADIIEANFSCPNVCSADGQLYQQPRMAAVVARRIRDAIGNVPLVLKIGYLPPGQSPQSERGTESPAPSAAYELLAAVADSVDALCTTNAISAKVNDLAGQPYFNGQPRGICGSAIHQASVQQVRVLAEIIDNEGFNMELAAVGGVFGLHDVKRFLNAGASQVGMATSAMVDPLTAIRIREAY